VSSWRCELRSFDAEEGGGSVTEEGGGISRGAVRPGICRGCDDAIVLCTSAMAMVAAQREIILFTDPKEAFLSPRNRDSRVAHACIEIEGWS
jgi:hypothetical protein